MMKNEAGDFLSAQKVELSGPFESLDVFSLPRLRPAITGVYFLFKGDECVYVGKSRRVHLRVAEHMRGDFRFKDFDSYSWVATSSESEAESLETYYIALLRPRLNIVQCRISPRGPRPKPSVEGYDLDAEIAKAKATGQCPRHIKDLIRATLFEKGRP